MLRVYPERRRVCPLRPELYDGFPMGQFHCCVCGCMTLAGIAHLHDPDTCDVDDIPDEEFEELVVEYSKAYEPLLNRERPPSSPDLPAGFAWVWVTGPASPHWAIRATGVVMTDVEIPEPAPHGFDPFSSSGPDEQDEPSH